MKKIVLLFTITVAFAIGACSKYNIAANTPQCITDNIKNNSGRSDWYVSSVDEYRYQGKLVYAFNPDNTKIADGQTRVYSADCNSLCSVGGFGGPAVNLCNGDNFFQKAVFVREIWNKYK